MGLGRSPGSEHRLQTLKDFMPWLSSVKSVAMYLANGVIYLLRCEFLRKRTGVGHGDATSSEWLVRSGFGIGPIVLGQTQHEVIAILGEPEATQVFDGATVEQIRQALGDRYDPSRHRPVAPRLFLNYLKLGVSVEVEGGVVTGIHAYTGLVTGYQKGDYLPFEGSFSLPSLNLNATRKQIVDVLGGPCREGQNEFAPIPYEWIHYYRVGLMFEFDAKTKRLSSVSVCPKALTI